MSIQTITSPSGDEMVVISRAEYEELLDAREHAATMRAVASGAMETLTAEEMAAYLAAPSAIGFWRKRRGKTQAGLAAEAGISQPFLAQIESGARSGDVATLLRLARALGVSMEDLVAE